MPIPADDLLELIDDLGTGIVEDDTMKNEGGFFGTAKNIEDKGQEVDV